MPVKTKGMGGHQSANMRTEEWLTPPDILSALGEFDLDPCSPINRPWDTAKSHYTIEDNGLSKKWVGRVWLNPPYGRKIEEWMHKMAYHGNGIALIFARTETIFFQNYVFEKADSLLFIKGRIAFCNASGIRSKMTGGAPSVLIAYGAENSHCLDNCQIKGKFIRLK